MKIILLAAVVLLAISASVHAGTALPDILTHWYTLNEECRSPEPGEACAARDKLSAKLVARGYCIYGHGVLGRYSKDKRHCYERRNLWPKE
jgi:hypothetical protein